MVEYKKTKGKRKSIPKNLGSSPFKRFVEIERNPMGDMVFYIQEIIEVVYNTIIPFIAGYYFYVDNPYRWVAFVFLLLPMIFRFQYMKKEKKSKIYFRL